ncbi:MAG: hypothetical protein ACLS73_09345, partial [Bilophila wadsworthia]
TFLKNGLLPLPKPHPLSPKTFVLIESLFAGCAPYRMSFVGFGCRGWRDALADWEVGLLGHCEAWILGRNFLSVFHEKGRVGWIGKPHEGDFSFEIFPHFYYISL